LFICCLSAAVSLDFALVWSDERSNMILFQSDGPYVGSPVERFFLILLLAIRITQIFFLHCFEYFATSGYDESGIPYSMFSVVVFSCIKLLPEGIVRV
jgi:hypothetical protein